MKLINQVLFMSKTGVLIISMCWRLVREMYSVMTQIHTYPPYILCIPMVYLIAHRIPSVYLPTYTHTNTHTNTYRIYPRLGYPAALLQQCFQHITFQTNFSLYFHQHIYLVHVAQNMIVMIIIIIVSPHSLSGSFVALSSSSTGTQAQAIPLTAQTWNPPYTFMLTVCQRLRGKCTKVIRY